VECGVLHYVDFFYLLERNVNKFQITAERIYYVDESLFTTVQKHLQKIVAHKGKRQVGAVTSGE